MIGAHAVRRNPQRHRAGLRQEILRGIFGAQPCLDGMADEPDVGLLPREGLAVRHAQLPFDQIETGDRVGHRVLDLQPRVHLHEEEVAVRIEQEFDRAGAHVIDGSCQRDSGRAEFLARSGVDGRRGGFLDQLLVAPLHRTVALAEMHDTAVLVGEHLHLNVARAGERAFEQEASVAERVFGLRARGFQRGGKLAFAAHEPHAAPAATGRGLDHHRIADRVRRRSECAVALVGPVVTRNDRYTGAARDALRLRLVGHLPNDSGRRPDPGQARLDHGLRKSRILGEEAVARMHGIGAGLLRRRDDRRTIEVRLARARRADPHCRIRFAHVQGIAIRIGVNRDRADAHAPGGTDDAARDLAAVGDQQLHGRATPNCTGRKVRASASRQIDSVKPSTLRVSRGSMMPSSSMRALVMNALLWLSKLSTIFFFSASICAASGVSPLRLAPASITFAIVSAACAPPITAVRALGQANTKSGLSARLAIA